MCGIFGYYHFNVSRSRRYVVDLLLSGLRRLEYRGYDSAGICISQAVAENSLSAQSAHQRESVCLRIRSTAPCVIKAAGNVDSLAVEVDRRLSAETVCPDEAFIHQCGLAHTRWATHGAPSKLNSHPHVDEEETFAVVHNGIITNYKALRQLLVSPHSIKRFAARGIQVYLTVHYRTIASQQFFGALLSNALNLQYLVYVAVPVVVC